jgi:hypothetical protein
MIDAENRAHFSLSRFRVINKEVQAMQPTLTTSAFRKLKVKPQELARTVEEAVVQAVTNRAANPGGNGAADVTFPARTAPAPEPDDAEWPMPVEQFQYGHFLEPGDIVLSTRLESFFSFLMKSFDDSRFAHAALTFITPRHYAGVDRSFLIEATFGGVDLGAFSEIVAPTKVYKDTREKPRYVVGIKRLEADWFTPEMRPMVSGRMLRFIKDDDYNFALLAALAANRSNFFFRLRDKLFGRAPTIAEFLQQTKRFAPVDFICSGFVQFAYVDMVRTAIESGLLSPELARQAHQDVFFAPWVDPQCSMESLMAVKPRELASSPKLNWKYLIYGGHAHRVSCDEEVNEIFERINVERKSWYQP